MFDNIVFFIIFLIAASPIFVFVNRDSERCQEKARSIGAESRFRLKCEVKINEKWIDIQEVKLPL